MARLAGGPGGTVRGEERPPKPARGRSLAYDFPRPAVIFGIPISMPTPLSWVSHYGALSYSGDTRAGTNIVRANS